MSDTTSFKQHDPALDGIRGIAVSLILFHHLVYYSGIDRKVWFDWQIFRLADSCWLGVDLFFVLSGFLITGILYEAKSSGRYYRSFYGRRILRIFPLYYAFLLVTLLIMPAWLPADSTGSFYQSQPWYWLYLSNLHITLFGWPEAPIGHFWSLAIEEQFYLLWPFVVRALNREQLLKVSAFCMALALALRIGYPSDLDIVGVYVLLPARMDCLAAGAFLALLIRGPDGLRVLGRKPAILALGSSLILIAMYLWFRRLAPLNPVVYTIGYTLVAVAFTAFLALTLSAAPHSRLRRLLSGSLLVALGKYSYGLYVIHAPVIWFLKKAGLQADLFPRLLGSTLPGVLVFSAVGFAISVGLAMLSFHFLEAPFLRLKRYFPYRDARTPQPAPAGSPAGQVEPTSK